MPRDFLLSKKNEGMTQQQLAEKIGTTQQVISKILNGKTCTIETLEKIADAFNVSTDEVLGRKTTKNPKPTSKPTKPEKPKSNSYLE